MKKIVTIIFLQILLSQNAFLIDYNNGDLLNIALDNPQDEILIGSTMQFLGDAEFGPANILYALPKSDNQFYQIDITNASMIQLGISIPLDGHEWSGLAYDITSATLYASSTTGNTASGFYTIDISTGTATHIGTTTLAQTVADIAFDDNGQMYAYNLPNSIYLINKTNGSATPLGNTGFNAAGSWHGLDYSFHNNTMYMSTYNSITWEKTIRTVNLETGSTTSVGNVNHWAGGFAITHPEAEDMLGDVNGDNIVNILDVVSIIGYIVGNTEFNDTEIYLADYNEDGDVNVLDIVMIVGFIIGN